MPPVFGALALPDFAWRLRLVCVKVTFRCVGLREYLRDLSETVPRKETRIDATTDNGDPARLSRREMRRSRSWRRLLPRLSWARVLFLALVGLISLGAALGVAFGVGSRSVLNGTFYSGVLSVSAEAPDAPRESSEEPDEKAQTMTASYYGREFAGLPTASGPLFDPKELTAAHKTLPLGTELLVRHKDKSVEVTVTDRGPYIKGREIDLSRAAAKEIGVIGPGTAEVQVTERR